MESSQSNMDLEEETPVVEETPAAKNEDAGSLLNGGAVRFGEK